MLPLDFGFCITKHPLGATIPARDTAFAVYREKCILFHPIDEQLIAPARFCQCPLENHGIALPQKCSSQ